MVARHRAHSASVSSSRSRRKTTLLPLDGARAPVVFAGDTLEDFALLEPTFLYRTGDMRFYRLRAPLQATALPAPLAQPGTEAGSYHAIRLP
jgi:hypothetical protein